AVSSPNLAPTVPRVQLAGHECRTDQVEVRRAKFASPGGQEESGTDRCRSRVRVRKTGRASSVLGWNWHHGELAKQLDHVEVEARLDTEIVLVPVDRDGAAGHFVVGRLDGAHRAGQRRGVRAFEDKFLDDPGATYDLMRDVDLRIRERLEPAVGVGEDRLFAFQPDVARSGERGVRCNQGAQRLLVVSVERLVELGCEDLGISGNGRHSAFLWNPSKNSRPSLSSGPHAGSLTAPCPHPCWGYPSY